jgi:hypothetical protein
MGTAINRPRFAVLLCDACANGYRFAALPTVSSVFVFHGSSPLYGFIGAYWRLLVNETYKTRSPHRNSSRRGILCIPRLATEPGIESQYVAHCAICC